MLLQKNKFSWESRKYPRIPIFQRKRLLRKNWLDRSRLIGGPNFLANYELVRILFRECKLYLTNLEKENMNSFNKFESDFKIAKPLRIVGSILFMVQLAVWSELVNFKYAEYLFILVALFLLPYIFMLSLYVNNKLKSTK